MGQHGFGLFLCGGGGWSGQPAYNPGSSDPHNRVIIMTGEGCQGRDSLNCLQLAKGDSCHPPAVRVILIQTFKQERNAPVFSHVTQGLQNCQPGVSVITISQVQEQGSGAC